MGENNNKKKSYENTYVSSVFRVCTVGIKKTRIYTHILDVCIPGQMRASCTRSSAWGSCASMYPFTSAFPELSYTRRYTADAEGFATISTRTKPN